MMMNYFSLYNIPEDFRIDFSLLEKTYFSLQRQYHPDRAAKEGVDRQVAIRTSMLVNDAYQTLKSPLSRAKYMLSLQGIQVGGERDTVKPDMELLGEIMEQREALAEIQTRAEVEALRDSLEAKQDECLQRLEQAFTNQDFTEAAQLTLRLSYLNKMTDEIRQKRLMIES